MRLASAQICCGTVINCITWNRAHSAFVAFTEYMTSVRRGGDQLQPRLAGNGVTSHALNYCTFVAGRQPAANCLWVDQTANISTVGSATSPFIRTPCLFPTYCISAELHSALSLQCTQTHIKILFPGSVLIISSPSNVSVLLFIHTACTTAHRHRHPHTFL